ncbi:MAG: UDP-N-acetyl-D-mannosamine dehydrogenase [Lentisphaeria bacterium]|nr:UDP-N-acetyl-D-mannosamine dehydrogenase [Lentisphaeria bacterium]NQZ66937.1 UDP-N-acetyl-D-mannosamine dehydrogenase [Lentisphaeria bacterium]
MDICVIGLGYIGLPTTALLAEKGLTVHGVDIKQNVVDIINRGEIHIQEPGLAEMIKHGVEKGFIKAYTKPAISDTYIIVVPTPFKGHNEPDISFVEAATREIIPLLKEGDLYILESTSPVGTTEKMARIIAKARPDLITEGSEKSKEPSLKIHIAYCPERVLPGNVMYELAHNDRVIGGIDEHATEKACEFYKLFVIGELHKTTARTAEMCKLTENASRDVQIAFANELSLICDKAGVDVWDLIMLANKHPRVNILQPGCGVGGHCIAVDPWFIVSDYPLESRLIGAAREINNHKAFWCAEKIHEAMKNFESAEGRVPSVALMGVAFKPNIDDLRESPAKYIISKTLEHDFDGEIFVVEPNVETHEEFTLSLYQDAYDKADIVAYLVAHDEFKILKNCPDKIILDFCGVKK